MHAYSDTDLRKFDLCKIFLSFSSVSVRIVRTGRVQSFGRFSFGVRTELEPCRPDDTCLTSGRHLYIVRTRATCLLLSEAASVRTSSIHRPDRDPTVALKCPNRRCHSSIPHKIPSFDTLWVFSWVFGVFSTCLLVHSHSIPGIFSSLSLFPVFFKLLEN